MLSHASYWSGNYEPHDAPSQGTVVLCVTVDRKPLRPDPSSGCGLPSRRSLCKPSSAQACVSRGALVWRCSPVAVVLLTLLASALLAAGRVAESPRADPVAGDSLRSQELLVNGGFEEAKTSSNQTLGWSATTNRRGHRVIVAPRLASRRIPRLGRHHPRNRLGEQRSTVFRVDDLSLRGSE